MANQTIGVNLKFSADVSAAKRAMAELQTSLSQINNVAATSANPGVRISQDLHQASQAAAQLRVQLQNAFNQDTGKLNLTKFNMEMKNAGMSLEQYRAKLTSIGPQGQQAFTQLAHSIAIADTSTISLSAGIQRLGTTFMNTLRYQLSSTAIMAFVQGITEAVDYTKELNESLNNIRIVTNYGVDEMKEFAKEANKAAKALSATTTAMTDASLIYFQQGLNMQEAQKRAEVTVKLANVTGEAVETVSDQLTAVWNNFYDGSQSLEYYVDILTALGAATASSSEEISEGLEKFAAVANTVGLSYEYATAALATVTATTRQSADVVGTAFKTLFARIQDLELGKELEDGVSLGQYSEGLATIGVNILDTNGNLKDMNDILDEMGAKWNTLSKAQQVSVAQTVAGVRQYTQLIALMDNWSYFQENLSVAQSASGELQRQQEIYAESWEAASERVTAALETIYNKLLDDEAFVDILDTLTDFLELVSNLIDGLGGLPGVLALVGTALMRVFSSQMATGINNMAASIRSMTPAGRQANANMQQKAAEMSAAEYGTSGISGQQGALAKEEANAQMTFVKNKQKMTDLDRQAYEIRLKELSLQRESAAKEMEATKSLEKKVQVERKVSEERLKQLDLSKQMGFSTKNIQRATQGGTETDANGNAVQINPNRYLAGKQVIDANQKGRHFVQLSKEERATAYNDLQRSSAAQEINTTLDIAGDDSFGALRKGSTASMDQYGKSIDELKSRLDGLGITAKEVSPQMMDIVGPDLAPKYMELADATDKAEQAIKEYEQAVARGEKDLSGYENNVKQATAAVREKQAALDKEAQSMAKDSDEALRYSGATKQSVQATKSHGQALGQNQIKVEQNSQGYKKLQKSMQDTTITTLNFGQAMQQGAMMISTLTMVGTSLVGVFKTLGDETISTGDKITTVLTTLGFMLPMVIGLFNEQSKALLRTVGAYFLTAGGADEATLKIYRSGDAAQISGIKAQIASKQWGGFFKTMGKFALWAVAIAAVVTVVYALAKAADSARNSASNFAASAAQGAKDAAEAYSQATSAFNELKQSIADYQEAMTGLQKLTKGTEEYTEALFNANEKALELISTNKNLQYHVDTNGLIVIDSDSLAEAQSTALKNRASAYSAKLAADASARDAQAEADKVSLGRKLEGQDYEWNDEDRAATAATASATIGGAAIGLGGAALGAKMGLLVGTAAGPIGMAVGAAIGAGLGLLAGSIMALSDNNDATNEEKKAMDALYKAYEKQGDAVLTEKGMRNALSEVGIDDEELISSLLGNKIETKKLMEAMKENSAIREAENRSAAIQQAHALDSTLQYREKGSQSAITEALTRIRTDAEANTSVNIEDYRDKRWHGLWVNAKWQGEEAAKAWAEANGLTDFETTNFSDDYIEYNYIDKEGNRQEKQLTYAQLAAWQTSQEVDKVVEESYEKVKAAVDALKGEGTDEGILSIIGGQDLISLSETELNAFATAFRSGKYNNYIQEHAETLGYETAANFTDAITEAINNWDKDEALAAFKKSMEAEIDGILSAGAEETEYSIGALENYTEALQKNTAGLAENADEWEKLEDKKLAAQGAVANAKFVKGVESLTKALDKNLKVLAEWNEASLETWEAADEVQTALESVFGVRVSADFIKENLKDIQDLAQGSTDNLEKLSRAAAEDFALNLDTASEENRNWFATLLNQFAAMANETDIGVSVDLDDKDYLNRLNQMLEAGEITAEQVQGAFGALGYTPDIQYRTDTQRTETVHYVWDDASADTSNTETATRKIVTVTENQIQVPYIAGEGTHQEADKKTGKGSQTNGFGLRRNRDVSSIGASLSGLKESAAKEKKAQKDEIGRYTEIKEVLSDIERNLDKISKAKDRAFGKSKISLLEQEIEQQKLLVEAEEEYWDQLKKAYNEDLDALDARFKLDDQGRIENYTTVLENLIDSDTPEEVYEEIKKSADQYMETLNELENQQEKVNEEILVLADKELEKIELTVDIQVQFDDRAISQLEFQLEKLKDPAYEAADAIALLGQIAARNLSKATVATEGIGKTLGIALSEDRADAFMQLGANATDEELLALLNGEGFTAGEAEDLYKYIDSLYDASGAIDEFYEQVMEKVNGAFEEMNTNSEKAISRIEQLGDTLSTYKNIIDLVGKDNLGVTNAQIRALGRAQIAQAQETLRTKQAQLKLNQSALEDAEKAKAKAIESGDKKAEEYWNEQLETIKENVWELEGEVNKAWTDTLQAAADDFENAVQTVVDAFEDAMSGIYGSFDAMSEAYDQQSEIAERYLADYGKIYELSKLNRDITKSIDESDNVNAKSRLRDIQEEINQLQSSNTKMTKYEVDELRARYELRLAEIALEEAQNAKSQVRMTRDSEGNWSYVYTANQDNIGQAQQNYEDKLYAYQELTQKRSKEMQDMLISMPKEFAEAMQAIATDMTLSEEERKQRMDETTTYYTEKYKYVTNQLGIALDDADWLYKNDWANYSEKTGYKISLDQEWQNQFEETTAAQILGYESLEDARSKFEEATIEMVGEITSAFGQWDDDVKTAFNNVGKVFDEFAGPDGDLNKKVTEVTGLLDKISDEFENYYQDAKDGFGGIVSAASEEYGKFNAAMIEWNGRITELTDNLTRLLELAGTEIPTPKLDLDTEGVQNRGSGKNWWDSFVENITGENRYYGTYYNEKGEKVRTSKSYTTEEEAKQAAKMESMTYRSNKTVDILREAAQSGEYKNYYDTSDTLQEQMKEQYGAEAQKGSKLTAGLDMTTGKDLTDYYRFTYDKDYAVVKGGFTTELSKDGSRVILKDKNGKTIVSMRRNEDSVQRILKGLANKYGANSDEMKGLISPSRDWIWDDPPLEVDDLKEGDKLRWIGKIEPKDVHTESFGTILPAVGEHSTPFFERVEDETVYNAGDLKVQNGENYIRFSNKGIYHPVEIFGWGPWESRQDYWLPLSKVQKYDTGGYTGSWDASGRLAMLHQKEIVLNAHDTENFLAAVNIVRDIAKAIDLQAVSYQHQLAQLAYVNAAGGAPQTVQQEVTIRAEFPNATDRYEIEAAFASLVNDAAQFANRKK